MPDKKVILVIEDERNLNDLICAELEDAGFNAISAYEGKQGLQLIRETMPDLVLLDIGLSDIDGMQLCRKINGDETLKSIPVVFVITSRADLKTKLLAFISGAQGYITKPFISEELIEQVQAVLKQEPSPKGY